MKTEVIQLNPNKPESAGILRAVELIKKGELVAFPTETVYGLGADALNAVAVAKIFIAKERPGNDPIIVHIAALEDIFKVAIDLPAFVWPLAKAFWPGPLTLVVRKSEMIPPAVTSGLDTVAVRMPSHHVALTLIREASVPIAAPSANLFGRPSPTTAQHVLEDLADRIPLILDGGSTFIGVESTVLDLSRFPPVVLRPGGITLEDLRSVIDEVDVITKIHSSETKGAESPGLMFKHYSPKAELMLFDGPEEQTLALMQAMGRDLTEHGKRVGILITDEDATLLDKKMLDIERLGPKSELSKVANRLFAAMRALDQRKVDIILARVVDSTGLGLAVRDRLIRAAGGKVVKLNEE